MAFTVIIDGKPCAGKTTISKAVEAHLCDAYGIKAFDAKAHALENGFFSGILNKFADTEIDSYKTLVHSSVRHALSYAALEESAWKNDKKYDVMLLQRSPYAFSFALDAVKSISGKEGSYEPSGFLYGVIKAWAGLMKPDMFIYLTADAETLKERFNNRADGKDRIHKKMISVDDSKQIEMLKRYMRSDFHVIDNMSSVEECASKVASAIICGYYAAKSIQEVNK
ncbi:MAG: AAA family ATPase [Candidatus Marsarchaeota archaeon]|nr:AAA family ATPase [Candidatus Marsarchaeota archaeon]